MPLSDRLPPLTALRAFEAVARHCNLSAAAAELHVTPGAISHQIRGLEDYLGVELFRRDGNRLRLSEAAQVLLPDIQDAFARLHRAMRRLREFERDDPLVVSVLPSFAAKWLMPRLRHFQLAQPGIDVKVRPPIADGDFARAGVDLAIRYGKGRHGGLAVTPLISVAFVPVCAPGLRTRTGAPIRSAADLADCVLIHDEMSADGWSLPGWSDWFAAFEIAGVDISRGPRFDGSLLSLEAAACGKGVALVMDALAEGDLASGRVIRPVDGSLSVETGIHLVTAGPPEPRKLAIFREWLLGEGVAGRPLADAALD